jgi:hypothetical protein
VALSLNAGFGGDGLSLERLTLVHLGARGQASDVCRSRTESEIWPILLIISVFVDKFGFV